MAEQPGLKRWLMEQRNSSRLAYALQMAIRVLASFMGLIWTRLILRAMGEPLNQAYLVFQSIVSLGGLGDLGMGGAVGIRASQYLGRRDTPGLQNFLASSRTVFLLLALAGAGLMLLLSPWLPHLFKLDDYAVVGPAFPLFVVGAVMVACAMLSSYVNSLNYACGNVVWPVIPTFILLQLAMLATWLLARQKEPLWVQYLPSAVTVVVTLGITRLYIRASHPAFAGVFPLRFNRQMALSLFASSFWVYLCSLGNAIYRSTDSLVIGAGFKEDGILVGYQYNYRFCDLAVFVALTASFVTLPKITQWMASADARDQERVRVEMRRLNQFQTLLGCGAALAYLAGNNLFMRLWDLRGLHPVEPAALPLQLAFALNMAVTASGDAGIQMSMRAGEKGIRVAGSLIGVTGLVNLALSLVAMKFSSLTGIALATVLAQSLLSLACGFYTCRHLRLPWLPWALHSWLLPVVLLLLAAGLRQLLPFNSPQNIALLLAAYAALALAAAAFLGINAAFIRQELAIIRNFIGR